MSNVPETAASFDMEEDPEKLAQYLEANGQGGLETSFEPSILLGQSNWVPTFVKSMLVMTESKERYISGNEAAYKAMMAKTEARIRKKNEKDDLKREEEGARLRAAGKLNAVLEAEKREKIAAEQAKYE